MAEALDVVTLLLMLVLLFCSSGGCVMWIVRMPDGVRCQFSTPVSVLAVLRRGGAVLVEGSPEPLLDRLRVEQERVLDAVKVEAHP